MSEITIADVPSRARFELEVDGTVASIVDYVDRDGVRVFPHTGTLPDFEGKGYGTQVVTFALEQTIAAGLGVVPACPFVRFVAEQRPDLSAAVR